MDDDKFNSYEEEAGAVGQVHNVHFVLYMPKNYIVCVKMTGKQQN